jgi:biotin transport system substrate-specific component
MKPTGGRISEASPAPLPAALPCPDARRTLARVAGIAGAALLTAAAARVAVPVPGSPVPGTLQTLVVLLAGAVLGPRAGAASQALYLALGFGGLPVFALPGAGPAYLLGPTGGYLAGFPAAAWLTGRLLQHRAGAGFGARLLACLLGSATLHLSGLGWLAILGGGDPAAAARLAALPLLPFEAAKIFLAAAVSAAWARRSRRGGAPWSDSTGT